MARVEASKSLKETNDRSFGDYDREGAIQFVDSLRELGCEVYIDVEDDDSAYDEDAMFIDLPGPEIYKGQMAELLVAICSARPDEISEEEDGPIRIWWD